MKKFFELYFAFFRVGLFTFGGGYAMLPMLEKEIINKHHWATMDDMMTYFAVGQCTPGVIAVNTATFVGKKQGGFKGAVASTLGIVTPSLIIITCIAALLENFADLVLVQRALAGVRVAVCALILSSVIKMFRSNVKKVTDVILCIGAFLAVAIFGASPIIIVVVSSIFGLIYGKWGKKNV